MYGEVKSQPSSTLDFLGVTSRLKLVLTVGQVLNKCKVALGSYTPEALIELKLGPLGDE